MDKRDDISYAAVITMTLPGEEKPINLTLTLTSTSPVKLEDGQVKLLRDCTLAELQQFADKMEANIWTRREQTSLAELIEEGETRLDVQLLDNDKSGAGQDKNWMEFTVTIPNNVTMDDSTLDTDEEAEQDAVDTDPEEITLEETAEAELVDEEPTAELEQEEADVEKLPELHVTVSEAEPVFEEREATTELTPPPITSSKIRILGKRRPLNHPTWTATDILMNEPAFRNAQAHSLSSLNREVAGFLIGPQPEKQPDGRYLVHISDVIIAKHTKMQGASVTYTPESWRYATDRLEEMYPDETAVIVGWYHTHPGFGIFLSGMDQFIHRNFFIQIWHVALVLDPIARRSGFFCWDRQQAKVDRYEFPWPDWAAGSW
ncbi:MAG: hypothetical protein WAM60_09560 [Candidatus Promineifilaceae bacterium]